MKRGAWYRPDRRTALLIAFVVAGSLIVAWIGPRSIATADTPNSGSAPVSLGLSFPTLFADATPAGAVDPHLAAVSQGGDFSILAGGQDPGMQASISTDLEGGATFTVGGESYAVAPTGPADAGVARDNTVVFYRPDETTAGIRPTGDGGVELIEVLGPSKTSTTYRLDVPDGTELVRLETGDIAVVRAGATPVPEIAVAANQLAEAEQTVVGAAVDSRDDAQTEVARTDDLEIAAAENDGPDVTGDLVQDGPPDHEVVEDDGSLPGYLREDATLDELTDDVAELEDGLAPGALTSDEEQQITNAERDAESAALAATAQEEAEEAAVSAAESAELNAMLDEELVEGTNADSVEQVTAELDIGDAGAEAERSAVAVVAAQREIGPDDRVEAIFAAPLAKTASGTPVVTSLDVTGPDEVTLRVPDGLDEAVVVDPFFVFAAVFVVRVVVQRVAPILVRAAIRYASRSFAQTSTRLAQAAARARQAQAAARAHAAAIRAAAQRQALQARAWAAAQARARAASIARVQQRLRAQAERARRIRQQQVRTKREEARRLVQKTRESGPRARAAVKKVADQIARRALEPARKAAEASMKQAMTTWRNAQQVIENTARAVRNYATTQLLLRPETRLLLEEALDRLEGKLAHDDKCAGAFASTVIGETNLPHGWIGTIYDAKDVIECIKQELGDSPEGGPTDAEREDLGRVLSDAYEQAQLTSALRAPTFGPAPAGATRSATIANVAVPSKIAAGKPAFLQISARNQGPALPLAATRISVPGGFPYLTWGHVENSSQLRLTDENGDGQWSHGEIASALVEIQPPVMSSRSIAVSYGFSTGGALFSTGNALTLNIEGPADTSAPTKPASVRKSAATTSSITMAWNSASDNVGVAGYSLYRSGSRVAKITSTSYKFTGLACGKSYALGVAAYDAAGNSSATAALTAATSACPVRTVSLKKGGSAQGKPGCSSSYCRYLEISFSNYSSATHTIVCRASGGDEGGYYTYTRSGTSGKSAVCYYGFPGRTVWATVDGVSSNKVKW